MTERRRESVSKVTTGVGRHEKETVQEPRGVLQRNRTAVAEDGRPPSRTVGAINAIVFVVVLAALLVAAYLNRARIGALWQQMTGKTSPLTPVRP